jgi:tRNA pseudouridine55 synthase
VIAPCDGLLLIDKPSGPTSHDVVAAARRRLGTRRIGHTGTLDPLASGLLLLAIGRATRLIRFLPDRPKAYSGTFRLGVRTDSDDIAGKELEVHRGPLPEIERVLSVAAELTGEIIQVPPRVSAKKVGGKRAYALARAGREVDIPGALVRVYRFEVSPIAEGGAAEWRFEVDVSPGTYVRALARDLGARLGCGATLTSLRRTSIGPFRLEDAMEFPDDAVDGQVLRERVVGLDSVPLAPPALHLDAETAARFLSGAAVSSFALSADDPVDGPRVVRGPGSRLLGVGSLEAGRLQPRVVLAP